MTLRKKLMLSLFVQPWNVLASAYDLIYNVCGMLGALLGPISGLYLVSYLFEHKTEIRNSTHQALIRHKNHRSYGKHRLR